MSVALAPSPVFTGIGFGGLPVIGGTLSTFVAGTSTPQATYVDSTQTTPNANPVQLNANAQCNLWLVIGQTYKLQLKDALGNQIWVVDQIPGGLTAAQIIAVLTQQVLGSILYPVLTAEGSTVVSDWYPYGNVLRYGADPTGVASSVTAFSAALLSNDYVFVPPGGTYKIDSTITITGNKTITGAYGGSKSAEHATLNHTALSGSIFSALSNEFGGIYIGNFNIQGGNGSYAIVSARPQSTFEFLHMEGSNGYTGGGIQLQSGSNGATAPGSWECNIRDCKWVGPNSQTAYRGYDLTINGGATSVERCIATRGSIGFCLNQGAAIRFIGCDANDQQLTFSSESNTIGQCGLKFTTSAGTFHESCEISGCYFEVNTAGIWIDDAQGLKISNCLTNDSSTFGSGGVGINLTSGAQNVTVSNCNITLNYSSEIGIVNTGANTVLENNMILVLSSVVSTSSYSTTTAMTVMNSLPLATSAAPSGLIFAGAPIDNNHLISDLTGDPRSFTGTLTGCTTAPTTTITYVVSGRTVTLNIPALSATSSSTACSITGVPNSIIPATGTYVCQCTGQDNSTSVTMSATMATGSAAINLSKLGGAAFTGSGTKGINASTFTYSLA
jgi:hypothetical protein